MAGNHFEHSLSRQRSFIDRTRLLRQRQ